MKQIVITPRASLKRQQKGAVLVVALVILLVMTMIGISSMSDSTLQERMAGNSQQKDLSMNAADTALKAAEQWLFDNIRNSGDLAQFNSENGLYTTYPSTFIREVSILTDHLDIESNTSWTAGNSVEVNALSSAVVYQNPRYIIEYIGVDLGAAGRSVTSLNAGVRTGNEGYLFRITAIGWGRNPNIYSVLESTYRTGSDVF